MGGGPINFRACAEKCDAQGMHPDAPASRELGALRTLVFWHRVRVCVQVLHGHARYAPMER